MTSTAVSRPDPNRNRGACGHCTRARANCVQLSFSTSDNDLSALANDHACLADVDQLHASLEGAPVLEAEELLERAADVEEQVVATKKAERFSAQFYTLNWLKRHPGWAGSGTCVALWQPRPG
jgi:hypothetical protein